MAGNDKVNPDVKTINTVLQDKEGNDINYTRTVTSDGIMTESENIQIVAIYVQLLPILIEKSLKHGNTVIVPVRCTKIIPEI